MDITKTENATAFYAKNSKLNDEILGLFHKELNRNNDVMGEPSCVPISILTNIMNNLKLFNVYKRSNCSKFINILDAIDNLKDGCILTYVGELQLCGIFTRNDYYQFLHSVGSDCDTTAHSFWLSDDGPFSFTYVTPELFHLATYCSFKLSHVLDIQKRFRDTIKLIHNINRLDDVNKYTIDRINHLQSLLAVSKSPQVYFIVEEPFQNRVKIGKSYDCEKRLRTLQTGSPNKLRIYHKVVTLDNTALESALHQKYKDRRIAGEWFAFGRKDLDNAIDELD